MKPINKEMVLLGIVIFIGLSLIAKTIKLPTYGTVDIAIMQQKGAISTVDTPQKLSSTKHVSVDNINFLESQFLEHPSLGNLGYKANFFINVTTQMEVKIAGEYLFHITSDDGFRLKIDNKMVCEHPGDRPMTETVCSVNLSSQTHRFELLYFQGGGPMGLKALYQKKGDRKSTFVGETSKYMSFKEIK